MIKSTKKYAVIIYLISSHTIVQGKSELSRAVIKRMLPIGGSIAPV